MAPLYTFCRRARRATGCASLTGPRLAPRHVKRCLGTGRRSRPPYISDSFCYLPLSTAPRCKPAAVCVSPPRVAIASGNDPAAEPTRVECRKRTTYRGPPMGHARDWTPGRYNTASLSRPEVAFVTLLIPYIRAPVWLRLPCTLNHWRHEVLPPAHYSVLYHRSRRSSMCTPICTQPVSSAPTAQRSSVGPQVAPSRLIKYALAGNISIQTKQERNGY